MTRHQRPANDLSTLGLQLRSSLEALTDQAEGGDARDYRRFLRQIISRGWRAAVVGSADALREAINVLREARPVVDDALPALTPRSQAATEVQQALMALYTGEDELRETEFEQRWSDRGRNPTERAILKVLASVAEPSRQGEVHQQLKLGASSVTASRVGQLLRELHQHGYAIRRMVRARGNKEVAHYALAPRGFTLCRHLGIATPTPATIAKLESSAKPTLAHETEKVLAAMSRAWAQSQPGVQNWRRRVLKGILQSTANAAFVKNSLERFGAPAREVQHEVTQIEDFQAVRRVAEPQVDGSSRRGAELVALG